MWTEAELDKCERAAERYADALHRAMVGAGVCDDLSPEELREEINVLNRHRSQECGYSYAPAVLCEIGGLELAGAGFFWKGEFFRVSVPNAYHAEPYTSYAVNIFPDKARSARRLDDGRIEVTFEDGVKVARAPGEPLIRPRA